MPMKLWSRELRALLGNPLPIMVTKVGSADKRI
jgi:hypothetical protein